MRKQFRTLLVGFSALIALGSLSACSSGSSTESSSTAASSTTTTSAVAAPFPTTATFVADTEADGKKMTIGISVDGDEVTAYACNGVDDEAWFFGNQAGGNVDITSKFRDTLTASFNGTDLTGDLNMNGVSYDFTAAPVSEPAGVYTAELDGVRSSWIVRADGSAIGVQFNGGVSGRDFEQAELQQLNAAQFQAQVRNKRQLQQADQSVKLSKGSLTSRINGREVTATRVSGTTRFG